MAFARSMANIQTYMRLKKRLRYWPRLGWQTIQSTLSPPMTYAKKTGTRHSIRYSG